VSRYGYGVTEKALERLTHDIVQARSSENLGLVKVVGKRPLTDDERETLREVLADELVETGLGPDDEPNERGRLIEAAIAWLGQR